MNAYRYFVQACKVILIIVLKYEIVLGQIDLSKQRMSHLAPEFSQQYNSLAWK